MALKLVFILRHRITQWALLLGAGVTAVWFFVSSFSDITRIIDRASIVFVLTAIPFAALHLIAGFIAWRIARGSEKFVESVFHDAALFFASQLGKYIPGGIGNLAVMVSISNFDRFHERRGVPAMVFVTVLSASTGLMIAAVIGFWLGLHVRLAALSMCLAALLFLALLASLKFRCRRLRPLLQRFTLDININRFLRVLLWVSISWVFAGFHIVILFMATGLSFSWTYFLIALASYAFAWSVGTLFIAAPAGIGAREAALLLFSAGIFLESEVFIVALVSRIVLSALDVGLAGWGIAKIKKPRPAPSVSKVAELDRD